MLVKEVMTKKVMTINRDQTVLEACNKYRDAKVGSLVVLDTHGFCVGIITERDIIERTLCEQKDPVTTRVHEIMTADIKTIHALDTVEQAITVMKAHTIKKLPVISADQIVGIITITDIYKARPDLSRRFMESWVKARWVD